MYLHAAEIMRKKISAPPSIGLILGSGLGILADAVENAVIIDYSSLPGFTETTVEGHLGRFVCGNYMGKNIIVMQGRFHYYEGRDMEDVILPVRVMKALGVTNLIVTNAAGGVNPDFRPGDIMLIEDHINLSGSSPLRGPNNDDIGPRFPDMTYAYDPNFRELAMMAAARLNLKLRSGVYAMMPGPSYETPAEIRMLRILGAHAVGMSTVPEVIAAVHAGIKVLGLSCITNMGAGIIDKPLNHLEVMETAEKAKNRMVALIGAIIQSLE
jgi:purine-nucleoside phosphorylase